MRVGSRLQKEVAAAQTGPCFAAHLPALPAPVFAMSSEDPEDSSASWTLYGGKCPHGSQCTKRDTIIKQCQTYEEAVESIINHLETSPYHGLSRVEAEAAVDHDKIEEWLINKKEWFEWQSRTQPKRKAPSSRTSEIQTVACRASGSSSYAGTAMVQLSEMQIRACVDSLKRAKTSAESAGNLCSKAARAFNEEVKCIQQCVEVVESYVPSNMLAFDPRST